MLKELLELRAKLTHGAGELWCDNNAYYFDSHANGTFDRAEYETLCEREEMLDGAIKRLDDAIAAAEDLNMSSLDDVKELCRSAIYDVGEKFCETVFCVADFENTPDFDEDEYEHLVEAVQHHVAIVKNVGTLVLVLEAMGYDDD